jgi:hypothetical protein
MLCFDCTFGVLVEVSSATRFFVCISLCYYVHCFVRRFFRWAKFEAELSIWRGVGCMLLCGGLYVMWCVVCYYVVCCMLLCGGLYVMWWVVCYYVVGCMLCGGLYVITLSCGLLSLIFFCFDMNGYLSIAHI